MHSDWPLQLVWLFLTNYLSIALLDYAKICLWHLLQLDWAQVIKLFHYSEFLLQNPLLWIFCGSQSCSTDYRKLMLSHSGGFLVWKGWCWKAKAVWRKGRKLRSRCHKEILEKSSDAQIEHFHWSKLVTWLATANQSALFHHSQHYWNRRFAIPGFLPNGFSSFSHQVTSQGPSKNGAL